jgi:hypothetical protein
MRTTTIDTITVEQCERLMDEANLAGDTLGAEMAGAAIRALKDGASGDARKIGPIYACVVMIQDAEDADVG